MQILSFSKLGHRFVSGVRSHAAHTRKSAGGAGRGDRRCSLTRLPPCQEAAELLGDAVAESCGTEKGGGAENEEVGEGAAQAALQAKVAELSQRAAAAEREVTCRGVSGFRVQGSGFRVQGSGFMIQGRLSLRHPWHAAIPAALQDHLAVCVLGKRFVR